MNKRETDATSFNPSMKSPGSRRKSAATYRRRRAAAIGLVAMMLSGGFYLPSFGASASAAPVINEPPVTGTISSFPARDFISATDWSVYPFVDVDVLRNGVVVGFSHDVAPISPTGLVEVNHPGSPCWDTITPNIVAGDIIRLTGKDANKVPLAIDQTTTAHVNITATLHATDVAGQVAMSGTAFNQDGTPMDIAELEATALSGSQARFTGGDFAGKRIMKLVSTDSLATNGRVLIDDGGGRWTALWTELNDVDYQLALDSESGITWLGAVGGANGSTTFEVGPAIIPGPYTAACNAPLAGPAVSTDVTALDFPAGEVGTTSAASLVHVTNTGFGTDPSTQLVVSSVAATGPDADQFVVSNTCSAAPVVVGGSCDVSVAFAPTSTTPSQLKSAKIEILSNAGNSTVSISATGYALTAGQSVAVLVAKPANLDMGIRAVANTSPAQTVVIKNIGNLAAIVTTPTITGAADFKIASQTCSTAPVAPLASCTIGITFTPVSETARAATLNIASNGAALSVGLAGAGLVTTNIVPFPHAPIALNSFINRDFVSLLGFIPGEAVTAQIIRHGVVVGTATSIAGADGIAEVNHPGGQCWEGTTPDIRAGDVLRVTRADGRAYEMTNADVQVTAKAVETTPGSGIVAMHGYARDLATGGPLPLGSIEARLIASTANPFAINGRRALTSADVLTHATLTFDPIDAITNPDGVNWTATWDFTDSPDPAADVALAGSEQNRVMWLGRDPLALAELTFSEDAPGVGPGPAAPCTAPAEAPSAGIAVMTASNTFPAQAAGDFADRTYKVRNIGTAPLEISSITFAGTNPADFSLVGAVPAPIAPNTTGTFTVRFSPLNVTVKGTRSAIIQINDNAVGSPHTSTATGLAVRTAAASILMTPAALTFGDTQVGHTAATQHITVLNEGAANLVFTAVGYTLANTTPGTTALDFSIVNSASAGHCRPSLSVPADGTCVIDVAYTPSEVNTRTATLTLKSNDAAATNPVATLTGTSSISADGAFDPPRLPIAITAFPNRDYVAAAGFGPDEVATVVVYRNGVEIGRSDPMSTDPTTGLIEINHVLASGCWATATPDLRPGDVVRTIAATQTAPDVITSMNQIHIQGDIIDMPAMAINADTVVMTGTAVDTFTGLPMPLGSFEPRVVSSTRTDFAASGRPDIRAGAALEGSLTMTGKLWVATFTGLSPADMQNALTGRNIVIWNGRIPANLNEATNGEWGEIPGGVPGCPVAGNQPALAAIPEPTLAPETLDTGYSGSALTGFASTNNVATFTNTGTVTLTGMSVGAVEGLNNGDFTVSSTTCRATLAAGRSCTVTVSFKATADGIRLASIPIIHSGTNALSHLVVTGLGVSTPTITAVAPTVAGRGATVTITGTLLTSTTGVTFQALGQVAQAATSFTVINDTTITAVIPANLSGTTNAPLATAVAVTTRGGTASLAGGVGGLTVNGNPPIITLVAPASGVAGNSVTITGSGFVVGGTTVAINGAVAAIAATPAATATSITVIVPLAANTTGAAIANAPLTVSTANGVATSRYTVGSTPILRSFTVPGRATRGSTISLVGTGFTAASTVTFTTATGTTVAAAVLAGRSATSLSVVIPLTAVQGLVTVNTVGFLPSALEFVVDTPPTITSFTPTSGAANAATKIVVTGNNFRTASVVKVGKTNVLAFTVDSPTQITITGLDPATRTGAISITAFGAVTSTGTFTVVLPPTITTFTPTTATANTTTVSVTGTNFVVGGTTVDLVQGPANAPTAVLPQTVLTTTATTITFRAPAGTPAGAYNVRVTNVAGFARSVANLTITLQAPTITSFTPTTATGGVTSVAITGTSFTATSTVSLVQGATVRAQTPAFVNPTTLTFTPAAATPAGVYTVRVTNAAGTATSVATLTVLAPVPTITSFAPGTSTAGGTQVETVTGTNFIAGTTVALVSGATVVAQTATIASSTSITFTPSAATAAGVYNVQVTNSAGVVTSTATLTVVGKPTITSITPNPGAQGKAVTITGTNLLGTGTVTWLASGVTQTLTTTTRTATSITLTLPGTATRAAGTITVDNGAGGVASIAFTVG